VVAKPDNVYRLRDRRLLGYAEFGDPQGQPVFYFHGWPGARLGVRFADTAGERQHARIIAPDRPGFGLSDPQSRRTLLRWPDDVVELADALGIDRFAVLGVSGGGPYAAACAYRVPSRLTGAAIVSGLGPFDSPHALDEMTRANRVLLRMVRRSAWLARPQVWLLSRVARRFPALLLWLARRRLPPPDREIAGRPEVKPLYYDDLPEAFRQGSAGPAQELALFARSWGFRLEDIRMPVRLYQGEIDNVVPVAMGRYQAEAIPECQATFYPNEGHLLVVDRIEEIIRALLGEASPTPSSGASPEARPAVTYHLVPAGYFANTDPDAPYAPEWFERDGFIHCTDGLENAIETANRYYKDDARDYLLLVIDKSKVAPGIRYEDPAGIYPHIYGPLNRDAIAGTIRVPRAADGSFLAPDGPAS
jgi:pimeloyl-ACP methyl ester carboxylesterase/uncharacterized protein (DUF952 family)